MEDAPPSSPASRKPQSASAPTGSSAITTRILLLVLLLNCSAAIYHSRHDPWSIAFVATSFTVLALLFHLIPRFESEPRGTPARGRIKAAVWILTSILTGMFSYKVAALMPLAAAILVWVMGASTVIGGFCMIFLCGEAEQANCEDELLKAAEDGAHKQHTSSRFGVSDLHKPILSASPSDKRGTV